MMRPGPCSHCGSPDRSRQCRYAWWLPDAADWKASGADAPCECDDYIEAVRRDESRFNRKALFLILLAVVVFAACWRFSP